MSKFQSRTTVVDAVKLLCDITWFFTPSSPVYFESGDWLVVFEDGTQYPMPKAIFEKLFTEAVKVKYSNGQ